MGITKTAQRIKQGEFCWIDLMASDLDAQTRFYEGLFGWTHRDLPTRAGGVYRLFHSDGLRVAGASQIGPEQAAAGQVTMWNTYVAADDVDDIADRAVRLGGKVVSPPSDVMSQGRMVGIEDPTGAAFFLWRTMDGGGVERFFESGSLIWNDLNTRDPERAAEFYRALLGWDVERVDAYGAPYWQISVDGTVEGSIMPMQQGIPAQVPSHWLVYFGTGDAKGFAARASALGARANMGPVEIPGMTVFAVLSDPRGATFAIMQPTAAG